MPKRKRSEIDEPSSLADHKLALQTTRLTQNFDHCVHALSKALKTSRGFERQKLGRREKEAKEQKNHTTVARLEEEVRVLKALDLYATAEKYVYKQLVKTKRVAESPVFAKFCESKRISAERPKSLAEANVTARLYKSNPVQSLLPKLMDGIRTTLGLQAAPNGKSETGTSTAGRSSAQRTGSAGEKKTLETQQESKGKNLNRMDLSCSRHGSEQDDDQSTGDADSIDFAQFDSRLASDDSEASNDSSSPSFADFSEEETPAGSQFTSRDLNATSTSTRNQAAAPTAAPNSTTFLPSLMMSGYWSGSESGSEDPDPFDMDGEGAAAPRRKNRMGQQARRALWEKKYGSRANHLQKQSKNKDARDKGWDPRKGATDTADAEAGEKCRKIQGRAGAAGSRMGMRKPRGSNGMGKQQGNSDRPGSATGAAWSEKGGLRKGVDKPLHPSWEAARRTKEQTAQVAFQGKKIVFD